MVPVNNIPSRRRCILFDSPTRRTWAALRQSATVYRQESRRYILDRRFFLPTKPPYHGVTTRRALPAIARRVRQIANPRLILAAPVSTPVADSNPLARV